jgi:hypothetical protein
MYIVIKSLKHYAQVILHNSIIFSMTYQWRYTEKNTFNVHVTVHRSMCIFFNQRDATYTMSLLLLSALYMFRAVFPRIIRSL